MELISGILYNAAPYVHFISCGLLLLAGLNIPISEDVVFIVSSSIAATIVPQNTAAIFLGCFTGAYVSDIMAYGIGRYAGGRILQSKRLFRLDFFTGIFQRNEYTGWELF
jgi:membrane protein DedA with SNARE-associated domain